jgi:hypothetical protein
MVLHKHRRLFELHSDCVMQCTARYTVRVSLGYALTRTVSDVLVIGWCA